MVQRGLGGGLRGGWRTIDMVTRDIASHGGTWRSNEAGGGAFRAWGVAMPSCINEMMILINKLLEGE